LSGLAFRLARQSPVGIPFIGYEGPEVDRSFGVFERSGRWYCHPSAEHNQYGIEELRKAQQIFESMSVLRRYDRTVRYRATGFHPPNRLLAALRYLQFGLGQITFDARFIFLVVTLESLLTTAPTNITRTFAQRLVAAGARAGFVIDGPRANAIYKLRSRIVHGELLPEEIRDRAEVAGLDVETSCHSIIAWLMSSPALVMLFGVRRDAQESRVTRRFIEALTN
jgi:hypothetical protein